MARCRLVVGDQSSAEVDQLRRTVNALLLVLQRAGENVTAGTSAEAVLESIAAGIAAGADTDPAGDLTFGTPTNVELVGLKVMNAHPKRPGSRQGSQVVELDPAKDA